MSKASQKKAPASREGVTASQAAMRPVDAGTPSFAYKIRESRDAWQLHRQMKVQSPLQAVNHKLKAAGFAASLGVAAPQLLAGPAPLEKLSAPEVDTFTLKPLNGTSSRGVKLLRRHGRGFEDLVQGGSYPSWEHARQAAADDAKYRSPFFIEELLTAPDASASPVDDFKFYCFYGRVGVVLQKRRIDGGRASYKWWDPSWEEVDTGRYRDRLDHHLPAPARAEALIAAAEKLSRSVPAPFLRVDLYDARKGVVFGEFTPHPGGFQTFSDEWDRILGGLYEEAAARLQLDLTHGDFELEAFWKAFSQKP